MLASAHSDQGIVAMVLQAVAEDTAKLTHLINDLQAPIYLTDAQGYVTHFNDACSAFAGRVPEIGKDRWCVTWRLYTEQGEFLPHEACPMATAILSRKPIRDVTAVAERPDGTRVTFVPFPTPIFGVNGELAGAVNVLIDISDKRQIAVLRSQAQRCRRLARTVDDDWAATALNAMANEYEAKARELGSSADT